MILVRNKSLLDGLILTFSGFCVIYFDSKSFIWQLLWLLSSLQLIWCPGFTIILVFFLEV